MHKNFISVGSETQFEERSSNNKKGLAAVLKADADFINANLPLTTPMRYPSPKRRNVCTFFDSSSINEIDGENYDESIRALKNSLPRVFNKCKVVSYPKTADKLSKAYQSYGGRAPNKASDPVKKNSKTSNDSQSGFSGSAVCCTSDVKRLQKFINNIKSKVQTVDTGTSTRKRHGKCKLRRKKYSDKQLSTTKLNENENQTNKIKPKKKNIINKRTITEKFRSRSGSCISNFLPNKSYLPKTKLTFAKLWLRSHSNHWPQSRVSIGVQSLMNNHISRTTSTSIRGISNNYPVVEFSNKYRQFSTNTCPAAKKPRSKTTLLTCSKSSLTISEDEYPYKKNKDSETYIKNYKTTDFTPAVFDEESTSFESTAESDKPDKNSDTEDSISGINSRLSFDKSIENLQQNISSEFCLLEKPSKITNNKMCNMKTQTNMNYLLFSDDSSENSCQDYSEASFETEEASEIYE